MAYQPHFREPVAAARCGTCGRGMSYAATDVHSVQECAACAIERVKIERRGAVKELSLFALAFLLGGLFATSSVPVNDPDYPYRTFYFCFMGFIAAGIVAGWRFISRRQRTTFYFFNGQGVILYYGMKMFFSGMIGTFLLPYLIFKKVKAIMSSQIQ